MIRLDNLTIGYKTGHRNKVVAERLCAEISDGTLTCLVGVNGIGKSTLIRTLAGFQEPLEGDVLLGTYAQGNVRSVRTLTKSERARTIGVVLTEHSDMSSLSVYDVVSFGRTPYTGLMGSLSEGDRTAVEDSMRIVGIGGLSERKIDSLSDGERQKVMIAKALAQQTPVVILDEPSAFLDYPSKEELMLLLQKLAGDGNRTILLSSHDLDIVRRFCDSFWIMERDGETVSLRSSSSL